MKIEGSSDWRSFVVPFFNREGAPPPRKLVMNLVLRGPGEVELGPSELVQFGENENPLGAGDAWWGEREAGLIGGIGGSLVGLLGALVGWLGGAGRARRFVLGALWAMTALGVVSLIAGFLALAREQPYAVYYPLLLAGVLCATLGLFLRGNLSKRYAARELRRMKALDF
jgi:hypothetical protein